MNLKFYRDPQQVHDLLNMFSQSTGDFYVFFDCLTRTVAFSENLRNVFEHPAADRLVCTLEEWRKNVDVRDIARLESIFQDLLAKKYDTYDLYYRAVDRNGELLWINSRGKCFAGPDGRPLYVLGRLSRAVPAELPSSASDFQIAELKKETQKLLSGIKDGFLLLVDVDDLKSINLKRGRDFGDALLKDVAHVIQNETPGDQRCFRVNGDWFSINLPGASSSDVTAAFGRIQQKLSGQCTLSAGCVSYTDYATPDADTLLQYAEIALDTSKAHGKNQLNFFSPEDYEKRLRTLELREELEASVTSGFRGFSLCYQPQIFSGSYDLYGAEALLRYTSPRLGPVSPVEFVPILEQTDLIYPVGMWVLETALAQCNAWRAKAPQVHMSVNMSYSQLRKSTVKQDVLNALRRSGLPGSALTIEVTESMELLNYPDLNQIFRQWKTHGISISVDDFGTGYSSLSRLKEMDIDEIKIDRCFVNNIQKSVYNQRLLNNIVELADGCQIHVCCEGVETAEELALLEKLQPSLYQGFLFARPCSEKEFSAQYLCPKEELPWASLRQKVSLPSSAFETLPSPDASEEIAQTILNAETDIFYLSDLDTYELYYLNPAGQKTFDVRDYKGKKCYQVLQGADKPCSFCTNAFLRRDSFHLWENKNEYCGRHFLLKDKLVEYQGKNVRLEVALDITKQELVSEQARERLAFADRIVGYMNTLSRQSDYDRAVDQVLASVGDFYQSDRAYLFEPSLVHPGHWDNTFEWCAPDVSHQKENLQNVSPDALARWLAIFEKEQSIILHNLAPLRESSPVEWEILSQQGIHRLIAVPVRDEGKTIGFIGVDNPRYAIHDDSQVRVLAGFLLTRIRQDRNERRYQALLRSSDQDVLAALQVGFWLMRLDRNETVPRQILFNEVAARLLGFTRDCSPAENCRVWYSRIVEADRPKLEEKLHQTVQNGALLQTAIHWRHPQKGIVLLRFSGIQLQSTDDWIELKGYCRILDET